MQVKTAVSAGAGVVLSNAIIGQAWNGPESGPLGILLYPFRALAIALLDMLVTILFTTVTIHPNPAINAIFQLTLRIAVIFSVLIVAVTGLRLIVGRDLGFSHQETKRTLPRLAAALGFSPISLPILQVGVEIADALVEAFRPRELIGVSQLAGITSTLVLVWFINVWALLAVVLLLVFRNVYLAFVAAVFPLVAVGWALPNTRPYSKSFISLWFVMLVTAPVDLLILRMGLALLEGSGTGLLPVANWILGLATFVLMLWVPYQLYGVSQAIVRGPDLAAQVRSGRRRSGAGSAGSAGEDSRLDREGRW